VGRISQEPDRKAALAHIVEAYLDSAHVAAVEQGCVLTTLGPEVARRPGSRPGITVAIRTMVGALARCLPGRSRRRALAALSTMVGAVVLARLADDSELSAEFLAAARDGLMPGGAAQHSGVIYRRIRELRLVTP